MARHGVDISQEVLEEIQRLYLEKKKTTHGAIKATIDRGIELALAELRGNQPQIIQETLPVPVNGKNINKPIDNQVEINTISLGCSGNAAWIHQLLSSINSGVGTKQFRELLAIFRSDDGGVIDAISSNLAAFCRIETISTALMRLANERSGSTIPPAKTDGVTGPVSGTTEARNRALRKSRGAIDSSQADREREKKKRDGTDGDTEKLG